MDKDFRGLGKLSVCLIGAFWSFMVVYGKEKGTRKAHREIYGTGKVVEFKRDKIKGQFLT